MSIIVVNGLSALRGGGQTYLRNFIGNLPDKAPAICVLVSEKNSNLFEGIELREEVSIRTIPHVERHIIFRVLWELLFLPKFLSSINATHYYSPGGIMVTKMPKNVTSVTAVRNMLPFDARERKRFPKASLIRSKLLLLRWVFKLSYRLADKIVFISNYSRAVVANGSQEIVRKSVVIPHGVNNKNKISTNALDVDSLDLLPEGIDVENCYLYVSILDVYKAQKEVVYEWRKLKDKGLKVHLILAGPLYNKYGYELLQTIACLDLQDCVHYIGPIAHNDLQAYYKSVKALVFASSCECCPNILLEKLSAGKPVFSSNIEPMPEFAGDAAIYFDPYVEGSLSEQVLAFENGKYSAKNYSKKALLQAEKYKWSDTVGKTIDFILRASGERFNVRQ